MRRTLISTKHLGVICAVSADEPLNDKDWQSWIDLMRTEPSGEIRVLLHCGAGAPDAKQRRDLFEVTDGRGFRFAVMTNSKTALMSMSAFEWMGDIEIAEFDPTDFDGALEFLDVADAFLPGLERKIFSLRARLESSDECDESGIRRKDGESEPALKVLHRGKNSS